jgi:hypothetical protein
MPGRLEAMVIDPSQAQSGHGGASGGQSPLEEGQRRELNRILNLSFNPLPKLTSSDGAFLWNMRYKILNRPDLLPAFVMSMKWQDSKRVQELYDLLDLWDPPSPGQVSEGLLSLRSVH